MFDLFPLVQNWLVCFLMGVYFLLLESCRPFCLSGVKRKVSLESKRRALQATKSLDFIPILICNRNALLTVVF